MKTLGLLGGMSFESTQLYYRLINERVREKLGGLHSAKLLLYSFDFAEIERLQEAGDWTGLGDVLAVQAARLEQAGAEALVLCTNTMHKVADALERAVSIPLLHIADATAQAVKARGMTGVGLLGTRYTMEGEFYAGRLRRHGLSTLVPDEPGRTRVHEAIYDELCRGIIREESRRDYAAVVEALARRGAECVVLGCTEIGLLLSQADCRLPVFDTTLVHARAAADHALEG